MFKIEIETGNDAFTDRPDMEIKRIIAQIIQDIDRGKMEGIVSDFNGNKVGKYGFKMV